MIEGICSPGSGYCPGLNVQLRDVHAQALLNMEPDHPVGWISWGLILGPSLIAVAAELGVASVVVEWILAHPTEAAILKAVGEEDTEAALTGTPFDPRNVMLDFMSQGGDDVLPRRQRIFGEPVEFDGIKVYPRSDIDWDMVDDLGRTNRERTQSSSPLAPLGADSEPLVIHHKGQKPDVAAEVTDSVHRRHYGVLHQNTGQYPSNVNRQQFNNWKRRYWRWRGKQVAQ